MDVEFKAWPKIPRGQEETVTITEKMDGTNACIIIHKMEDTDEHYIAGVQSRNRFIVPGDDNFGFAGWVERNTEELLKLGEGYHYGEWTGLGIQKNPHNLPEKKFFLFDSSRWGTHNPNTPSVCEVVPTLYVGQVTPTIIEEIMTKLEADAEKNGYTPEGVIVYFHRGRRMEKHTFKTPNGKWTANAA